MFYEIMNFMSNFISLFLLISFAPAYGQSHHYTGSWTKENTTYQFDFVLQLQFIEGYQVEGHFDWTLIKLDENNLLSKNYYRNKIGMKAKEFVRGNFNPNKQEYILKGYKKDDPNLIIGLDTYHIKVDKNGRIGGTTNANGSWLGRINGVAIEMDLL